MKKLVYVLLLTFAVGIFGTMISFNRVGGFSFDTVKVNDEKIVDSKDIKNIDVDMDSTDVHIKPSNDDEIKVELKGEVSRKVKEKDFELIVEENGDTLNVSLDQNNKFKFSFFVVVKNIDVYISLPEKLYKSINVSMTSGDTNIEEIKAEEFVLGANSGDINAKKLDSKTFIEMKVTSGDVESTDNHAEEFEYRANSGDITVNDQASKKSTIKLTSGEAILNNVIGDITASANSGSIDIRNEESTGNISAKVTSGDVNIEFDKKPSSLAVDFSASSGDGNVDIEGFSYEEKSEDEIVGKIGTGEHEINVRTNSGDFNLR